MNEFLDDDVSDINLKLLKSKKIAVIGCGGLGGYVLEMLARFGIGEIVVVDDDVFDSENLNRQVIQKHSSIGKYKVNEFVLWIKQINPSIYVKGIIDRLNKDNAIEILTGVDMVVDCVDNVESKFILQSACEKLNIPLIHGAVELWRGHVCTILPNDRTLDKIYKEDKRENELKKPSIIPASIAAYQVAECIKLFLNKGEVLRNEIMYIDMLKNKIEIIKFE